MSDETLREVASLLFGDGADELVAKFKGTPEEQDRKKRQVTAGLSAVGATAGAAGLGLAGKNVAREYKSAPKTLSRLKRVGTALKSDKFAATLLPLEVAGLGGELMATKILHGDSKSKVVRFKQPVKKSEPGTSDVHIPTAGRLKRIAAKEAIIQAPKVKRGALVAVESAKSKVSKTIRFNNEVLREKYNEAVRNGTAKPNGKVRGKYLQPVPQLSQRKITKSADVTWEGEISKVDTDKRQVFGWASIVELNGEPVVDLQGDYIDIDEIEKSAYDYVIKSRKGGNMHLRDGENPVHVSDMIESFLVTPEKKEKLGLPDSMPTGWWVGYQINDDDAWNLVKSGKRTGFSIHGRGQRTDSEI